MALNETREREKLYLLAANILKQRRIKSVLDAACGNGTGTGVLAKVLSLQIVGLDLDQELIGEANTFNSADNVKFIIGDARKTRFGAAFFDAIVSFHTIEHFGDDDQRVFLAEMKRILKNNGLLLLATPDRDVWSLQGIAGLQEDHIKELNRPETEALLAACGWKIMATYGQFILKQGRFPLRHFLNFLKKLDTLKLRRLLGKNTIDDLDKKTQPVVLDDRVLPLGLDDKASVSVFVCRKAPS